MAESLSRDELLNAGRQKLRNFQRRQSLKQQRRYSVDQGIGNGVPQPTESTSLKLSDSQGRHSLPSRIVISRRSNSLKHSRSSSYGASSLLSPTLTVSSVGSIHLTTVQEDNLTSSFGDMSLPSPPADPRPQGNSYVQKEVEVTSANAEEDVPTPSQSAQKDADSIPDDLATRFPKTTANHDKEEEKAGKPSGRLEESLIWIRQNARLSDERQQLLKQLEKEKAENEKIQSELDELRNVHRATQRSWSRINEDLHAQLRLVTKQKQALVADKGLTGTTEVMLNELDQLRQDLDQRDDLIAQLFSRHVGQTDSETSTQDSYDISQEPIIIPPSDDAKRQIRRLREERDAWKQVARNLEMRVVELSGRSGNGL
ncbi:hypothetical protein BGW37DRAFT_506296 [Umbelopsis sp. PMI_123]|nr:hypothetical protein BGW37DRAFT_506296 [Umbelopsis sp. PMI_123]